ncbi:hypothetical protein TL16_g12568 [Triparma laevis f. inornata]|uniref:XPG-I domain-containing protein n=1 Tax=Triparma laevis f. inornata TaxID=1714386 RepID=A0A9W7EXA5_9STRA|nr:hypothetical protein TL16_g12568 [Triparma laevis f. inornata]
MFFTRTVSMMKIGVKPVFVFDSPSLSHNPTFHTHQSRIAHLISELGLTYHRSSSNAESLCSLLHLSTPDSGVVTNDTDAFAYGCERTFKNVTCETINREKNLCVKLPEGWGRRDVITFAALVGSDVCPGINNVGTKTAQKFIQTCKRHNFDSLQTLENLSNEGKDVQSLPTDEDAEIFLHLSSKIITSTTLQPPPHHYLKIYTIPPHSTSSPPATPLKLPTLSRTLIFGFTKSTSEVKTVKALIELQSYKILQTSTSNPLITLKKIHSLKSSKYELEFMSRYKDVEVNCFLIYERKRVEEMFGGLVEEFIRRDNRMKMNVETVKGRSALFGLQSSSKRKRTTDVKNNRTFEPTRRKCTTTKPVDSVSKNEGKIHRLFSPGSKIERYHMSRSPTNEIMCESSKTPSVPFSFF